MRLSHRTACVGLFTLAMILSIAAPSCVLTQYPTGLEHPAISPDARPAEWSQPIEKPGLPNLHKVSDDLYRGAQPTAPEGFRQLKAMGIKTVVKVNRCEEYSDDPKALSDLGLGYVYIPIDPSVARDADVVAFLKVVTDKSRTPVFVHCTHGADRAGMLCAAYRVVVCGWSKDAAVREMTEGGFHFHVKYQNLVQYIRDMDVEKLKREADLGR